MGLTQGAGIFLAIQVCCSLHPCGGLAQEFPAPAHVLSLCLFVYVGDCPHGACVSSTAGSGFLVLGSPSSNLEHGFVLAIDLAQRISSGAISEQYPSKFKILNKEL